MSETIEIKISPAGKVKIDALGYVGDSCSLATQHIEIVLGGQNKKSHKPEYFSPPIDSTIPVKQEF